MKIRTRLRLLGATNNARGDLFTRLAGDLFFALGYDSLRFDVHKSGREIDIQGSHSLLPRRLLAECKAHAKKMGGADVNKFFGAVSTERGKNKLPVDAYFVALNGLTAPALEQIEEADEQDRIVPLDGEKLIEHLTRIGILISPTAAAEHAGRCAEHAGLKAASPEEIELLGHPLGYLWALYYTRGKQRTHFALVHADGTPLAERVAQDVIEADRKCKGSLQELEYLPLPTPDPGRETVARSVVDRYRRWVGTECGDIQLDGLPADADLSTFRMRLERLFVPLKLVYRPHEPNDGTEAPAKAEESVVPIGEFLGGHSRFSLLAKPGGGKSTLLKRLAVAYAESGRLHEADDALPEREWLPLVLRCRELRDCAHRPIRELLDDLPRHAGMNGTETEVFRSAIDDALRTGQALLLIDGLDEISDEGVRTTFARHLRTFLSMFPQVAMVLTSREAGYRHVAGVIASACEQTELAPFDKVDVERLCERWHVEVVGDNEAVRADAKELASTIWENERIRALAENPLMLTTLLVIRRCIGELPTRRVELYREAVRVLIRTWNTEGFAPMDLEETLAQLSYVACVMMNEGIQQVGHRRLLKLLHQARGEMQAELQFTKISPEGFVERIEYRSSLLMQTGHERVEGELQPVYEFRHLTFQEYLAARGFVEEQYPGRDEGAHLVDLLEHHFEDERWREVVPLAAVLAGRKAEEIIKRLTKACEGRALHSIYPTPEDINAECAVILRRCLLDEVQVTPATLRRALKQMGRFGNENQGSGSVLDLRRGKFGAPFQEVIECAYFGGEPDWEEYHAAMWDLAFEAVFRGGGGQLSQSIAVSLRRSLTSGDRIEQTRAAFACAHWGYSSLERRSEDELLSLGDRFAPLRDAIAKLLVPDDPQLAIAACWALAWAGRRPVPVAPPERAVLLALYHLWRDAKWETLRHFASWAFAVQPLLDRETFGDEWGDCDAFVKNAWNAWHEKLGRRAEAALVLAWYRRSPWSDSQLAEMAGEGGRIRPALQELRARLDESKREAVERHRSPTSSSSRRRRRRG